MSIPDEEPDLTWFNEAGTPSGSESDPFDQSPARQLEEIPLDDARVLDLGDS